MHRSAIEVPDQFNCQNSTNTPIYPSVYMVLRKHGNMTTYVIDNVNGQDYDECIRRLNREHNIVIHARTREIIVGCTSDEKLKVQHTKHLGGFPTVAFHRATNRVQVSGSVVVQRNGSTELATPTDTHLLSLRVKGELAYKATSQYKTVWNTRGQRRNKA